MIVDYARVNLRESTPEDAAGLRALHTAAFGGEAEAGLVEALTRADAVRLSLLAEYEGRIIAHVLFSPVRIIREGSTLEPNDVLGLAPMAVHPDAQRQGIGSQLLLGALSRVANAGAKAVVVLGHPEYYPRLGFVPAAQFGLRWEQPCPPEAFMVLELVSGSLAGPEGVVRYAPEFDGL